MLSDETIRQYEDDLDETEEIAVFFQRLRRDGYSRKEAVWIILEILDLSLAEAKKVFLTSDTWAEVDAQSNESSPSSSVPPAPG